MDRVSNALITAGRAAPMDCIFEELASHPAAVVADAVYKTGGAVRCLPSGMRPLDRDSRAAGPVTTVRCDNDLIAVLEGLMRARPGDVLLVDNRGFTGAGCIGDVVVAEAQRKRLAGIVVHGCIRDSRAVAGMGVPVFHMGLFPVGPLKLPGERRGRGEVNVPLDIDGMHIAPGDVLVGDADGVIIIQPRGLEAVVRKAVEIERQERELIESIARGADLAELFALEDYLSRRDADPGYTFDRHLAERRRTI
jgi:4-hydroxy-4-methyl-2-oxoglutarate aldolase